MDDKAVASPQVARLHLPRQVLRRLARNLRDRQDFVVLVLFFGVLVFLGLGTDTFLSNQNLSSVARNVSWIAIVALGQSLVLILGGIDLSVGATLALAGLIAASVLKAGLPVPLAILAGLLIGAIIGGINGIMVARVRLPPFIVTLATMSVGRGIAYGLTQGWSVTNMPQGFLFLGQYDIPVGSWSVPLSFLLTLAMALTISLLLNRTVVGGYIFAMSSGERALQLSGVDVVRLKVLVYTLCGILAAAGGLLMTARLGVAAPAAAIGYEVDVVAAAVIGGTSMFGGIGSPLGVLLGAAIIQMLYNGLILLGLSSYWQTVTIGAMILIAVLLDYWRRRR